MATAIRLLFVLVVCSQLGLTVSRLFVTDPGKSFIYQIDPDNDHGVETIYSAGKNVVGITYDEGSAAASNPRRPSLIFSDLAGGIYRSNFDDNQIVLMYNLSVNVAGTFADRLDLDPTSGNVYFTTLYYVGVLTPRNVHVKLVTGLGGGGRAIAVVPDQGILFYTDHSDSNAHIGRATMDGKSSITIVRGTDVVWPNGLSVDYTDEILYWTDGSTQTLWRCNYDGGNRETLITNSGFQFVDVLLEDNFIYVTEWTYKTLLVYDKANLSNYTMLNITSRVRLDSIVSNSTYAKLKPKNQVCAGRMGLGDCSDACLPNSTDSYNCGCPTEPYIITVSNGSCDGTKLCQDIQNGMLDAECSRYVYETCNVACDSGYTSATPVLVCTGEEWDITDPCQDIDECAEDTDDCDQICSNTAGSFLCFCNNGFSLDPADNSTCNDIDECAEVTDDCDQKCSNTIGSFVCSCNDGFLLDPADNSTCNDIDECAEDTDDCEQKCSNIKGGFLCSCNDGLMLDPADNSTCNDIDECAEDTDDCDQKCSNIKGSFLCSCNDGFLLDPADNSTCNDIDECAEDTDDCEQKCSNIKGGFLCSCNDGFMLDPADNSTCNDIDECAEDTDDCDQKCSNTKGRFLCSCNDGFLLDPADNSTCNDIDECAEDTDDCEQKCSNIKGGFLCSCNDGFMLDPADNSTCNDIDECAEDTDDCDQKCSNTKGSFLCSCNDGFLLDPADNSTCNDIDECAEDTDDCDQKCSNTKGSFLCSCNDGFLPDPADNSTCNDLDECAEDTDDCDQKCSNTKGSFLCSCNDGFLLDPTDNSTCNDVDECTEGTDKCSYKCTNTDGSFVCSCKNDAFILDPSDNSSCIAIKIGMELTFDLPFVPELSNRKSSQYLQLAANITTMIDASMNTSPFAPFFLGSEVNGFSPGSVVANVTLKFNSSKTDNDTYITSDDVDTAVQDYNQQNVPDLPLNSTQSDTQKGFNECSSSDENECEQICVDNSIGYSCQCYENYTQNPSDFNDCIDINECETTVNTCEHTCVNTEGAFYCDCNDGFEVDMDNSSKCNEIDECTAGTHDCQQQCLNTIGNFTCSCYDGFNIDSNNISNCIDIDECSEDTHGCDHQCNNTEGSYWCICNTGFRLDASNNKTCNDIDECSEGTHNCEFQCSNTEGSFECLCDTGFVLHPSNNGSCNDIDECQQQTDECEQTCVNTDGSYECTCEYGYEVDSDDPLKCNDIDECANTICDSCQNSQGGFSCMCGNGYVNDNQEPGRCRVPLLVYGAATEDLNFTGSIGCTGPIVFPYAMPFFLQSFNNLYVSTHGFVTFGSPYNAFNPQTNVKAYKDRTILAALHTTLDFRVHGTVFYNHYSKDSDKTNQKANILNLQRYISQMYNSNSFQVEHAAVITWHQAMKYYGRTGQPTATFQLALVTDWSSTYLIFIYGENQMQWNIPSWTDWSTWTLIGYIINGGVHRDVNIFSFSKASYRMDSYAETKGVKGILVYKLTEGSSGISGVTQCMQWYNGVKDRQNVKHEELVQCPCTVQLLDEIDDFYEEPNLSTGKCFITRDHWRIRPNAMRCCYDFGGNWDPRHNSPGGFVYWHPRGYSLLYSKFDSTPRQQCCSDSWTCAKYRELRPVGTCFTQLPSSFANLFGDPHIVSLDGKKYTFNGLGEYTLLRINTSNSTSSKSDDEHFILQGRTERAVTSQGKTTDATVFTAFAARDHTNATLHVQLGEQKTTLILYGDGVDLSRDFNNKSIPFNYTGESLVLFRVNKTLKVLFTSLDISLRIRLDTDMLGISLRVPKYVAGQTSGLLGNYDSNPDNDFIFPDGTNLEANSTEKEVFPFGQSWMTSEEESVFMYFDGLSFANYSHPDFVPRFLEDENQEVVANATLFCGEENLACIYDLVVTNREDIANNTKISDKESDRAIAISKNTIPVLNSSRVIYSNVGEEITAYVEAFDMDAVQFSLTGAATLSNVTDKSAVVKWIPEASSPAPISVKGTDSLGMSSAALQFELVLCNGCSGHGQCDYTTVADGYESISPFPLATCVCESIDGIPIWSGISCEHDVDGCSISPCSIGQDCTDLVASEHKQQQKARQCGPCPDGFEDDGIKCSDIDECATTNVCEQICVNSEGSFYCICNTGYRQRQDNLYHCEDVNECDEALHDCEHKCTNVAGSYNCTCYSGYKFNDTGSCVRDSTINECELIGLNCDLTAGCTNESGTPECFCLNGFELTISGTECTNINECRRNVCPQKCVDTVGSYVCSCYAGYKLLDDSISCQECDSIHWGSNCDNTCYCGRGTDSCDKVHGCVCRAGWTGRQCDTDINECKAGLGHCTGDQQICHNTEGSFYCSCEAGYQMTTDGVCSDIDECLDPGLNECDQVCSNTKGSFVCSCREGYVVDTTDISKCIDFDECVAGIADCEHKCENVLGKFNCYCYFGYILNEDRFTCRKVDDLCAVFGGINCSHICVVDQTTVTCDCPLGYELAADNQTCKDIDECTSSLLNKCSRPDLCRNLLGGYDCLCPTGQFLQNDRRTCKVCDDYHYGDNCAKTCDCGRGAGHCDPVKGCVCNGGWLGDHCDIDLDECTNNNESCPGDNSMCVNKPGGYSCPCREGYKKHASGECRDINECLSPSLNTCDQICLNTNGSFICQCQPGFIYTDGKCTDINECAGPHDCHHNCYNSIGSYRCSCNEGYSLDLSNRKQCLVIDQCGSTQQEECRNRNADCVVLQLSTTCTCWKGYSGDANSESGCQDIKECEQNPSPCERLCTEEPGGYKCSCPSGLYLDQDKRSCKECSDGTWGLNCQNACNCSPNSQPTCDKETGGCECKPGFEGDQCDDINECSNQTHSCPVNSQCTNTPGSYNCECNDGYLKSAGGECSACDLNHWGPKCSRDCLCNITNTARCDNVNGSCECRPGWTSASCYKDVNECEADNACPTNEKCQNTIGSYKCDCKHGYIRDDSKTCIDLDECKFGTHTCTQVCINVDGGFTCDCHIGYRMEGGVCIACPKTTQGYNCSDVCVCNTSNVVDVNQPCDPSKGNCACKQEWHGPTCDADVDECLAGTHTCNSTRHRECRNKDGGYDCVCSTGYQETNDQCETIKTDIEPLGQGFIIGIGVTGGVIVLAALATLIICCRRKQLHNDPELENRMQRRRRIHRSGGETERYKRIQRSIVMPKDGAGMNPGFTRFEDNRSANRTAEWIHQSLDSKVSIPRPSVGHQFPNYQNNSRKWSDFTDI